MIEGSILDRCHKMCQKLRYYVRGPPTVETRLDGGNGLLRTPLEAGTQGLRNERGRTTWNMQNDFPEALINAVNTQGLSCNNNLVLCSVCTRQAKDGEAADEVCVYTVIQRAHWFTR